MAPWQRSACQFTLRLQNQLLHGKNLPPYLLRVSSRHSRSVVSISWGTCAELFARRERPVDDHYPCQHDLAQHPVTPVSLHWKEECDFPLGTNHRNMDGSFGKATGSEEYEEPDGLACDLDLA